MKKNDLLLLAAVILYSYLFYQQYAGINFLLFNIGLISLLTAKNGLYKNLLNRAWWYTVAGSFFSSLCILLYGNTLSVIANIVSLSLVAAFSVERNSSLFFAAIHALYSYLASVIFMIKDWIRIQKSKINQPTAKSFKLFMFTIPFFVFLVFFFLYRESNPLFKNFTSQLNVDFITWAWIQFTFLGFILLYGYFYHRPLASLANRDLRAQSRLFRENFSTNNNTLWGININLSNELSTGIILFALLNILLLVVNVLDFQYVWLSHSLPEGMSFSESVHQGTDMLITSILLAVLIILIYFRGNLNFYTSGKTIRLLAYCWVAQNAFMILSTMLRNHLYIQEYSLTYKRIGVYVYLLLCLIGLVTTFIKIMQAKSNWYLFRANSWLFYAVLVLSAAFSWDRIITEFNLAHSKTLDRNYLIHLSSANTDQLIGGASMSIKEKDMNTQTLNSLHRKMFDFLELHDQKEWKSWNAEDQSVHANLLAMRNDPALSELWLFANGIHTLAPIRSFTKLKKLELADNQLDSLRELSSFPMLESLNLNSNNLHSIQKMPVLKNLSELTLSQNSLREYSALKNLPHLKKLDISHNIGQTLNSLPVLTELHTLDVSGNKLGHLSILRRFPNLHILKMNNIDKQTLETLPMLPGLTELELRNINLEGQDEKLICAISDLKNLKSLTLSSNNLQNLYMIPNELFTIRKNTEGLAAVLSKLPASVNYLDVSYNKITSLHGIETMPHLDSLDISSNELTDISSIEKCTSLEMLLLSRNRINSVEALHSLSKLKSLSLDNNNIQNVNALKSLTALNYLNLSANQISDTGPLAKLTNLTYLNLSGNENLTTLTPLEGLTNLKELDITNCNIPDLSPLYKLGKLEKLYCTLLDQAQLKALQQRLPGLKINDFGYDTSVSYR
ncbi:MAG TPA: DUF4153 domain-containing protein [Cytophagaceae bacterium]|nr:DUF4153 domain-containing protein [Cytophagaceae bacterium]